MHRVAVALRAPFTRRAGAELAYCLVGFPLAVGFVAVLLPLVVGTALTATLIGAVLGLLLLVAALCIARGLAVLHRGLAIRLLGEPVATPAPFRPATGGMLGGLDARLRDATAWRSTAYVLAKLPVAAVGGYAVGLWITAVINLTTPLRWVLGGQHPATGDPDGVPVITPLPAGGPPHISTLPGTWVAVAIGAATLLVAPWFTRGAVAIDRWLVRALLGPAPLAERVRDLEESRAIAVDDATARLRRLERDLHDGAQVRLVALAMSLDMVKEKLGGAGGPVTDPDGVRRLADTAHRNAAETLAELRDLSRGIHPPALDDGLADALATLAARSPVPVELSVDTPERPTAAIETIAYFCAAELLANVAKHSGAKRAALWVAQEDGGLRLRVSDDGHGGARPGPGSGLTGLIQRVRTVDGTLSVSSPDGGPTMITVALPLRA